MELTMIDDLDLDGMFTDEEEHITNAADPIRDLDHIRAIKDLLREKPRELALFLVGISTNLRGGDVVKITMKQAADALRKGQFVLTEQKTSKKRLVYMNAESKLAVERLFRIRKADIEAKQQLLNDAVKLKLDGERLFVGQRGPMTRDTFNKLVQIWCKAVGVPGKISGHTLRKTYGFHQFHRNQVPLAALMSDFNHSTMAMTLRYIGVSEAIAQKHRFEELQW